jgi:ABC-type transport system substrate-binding protein
LRASATRPFLMPIRSASARPRAQRTGALQTAQELLAGAGYPEGFDVRFDYPAYRQPVCSTIGASLQEIGIQVEVALQPPEEVGQKERLHPAAPLGEVSRQRHLDDPLRIPNRSTSRTQGPRPPPATWF